jgi:hypothetical protein
LRIRHGSRVFVDGGVRRLLIFLVLGPTTVSIGEAVHEVLGHCLFTYLLGGRVLELQISPLAPYIPSRLLWEAEGMSLTHQALIASSGITVSLLLSFALLLASGRMRLGWRFRVLLFWFSFWTFINPVSYMLVGLFLPFGDIQLLMELGAASNLNISLLGLALTPLGVHLLSERLRGIFSEVFTTPEPYTMLFWLFFPFPLIASELVRTGGQPSPMLAASILILLLPAAQLLLSLIVHLISSYDPRERLLRLREE